MATKSHIPVAYVGDSSQRLGLKAPGMLTFLVSLVIMLAVLGAKYFGASIPGLTHDATQFSGLLAAYVLLMFGCLLPRL